jgi:hypothetical protein
VLGEALRCDHLDTPGVDVVLRRDAEHATEVVHMTVGVDDRTYRPVTAMCPVQRQRGCRGLGADQRVDDDDSGVALDDRHVRQIQAAHLVDAFHDLEQTLLGHERRLPPQARVDRRRRLTGEERVAVVVPHAPTVGGADHARPRTQEPAVSGGEVGRVVEWQRFRQFPVDGLGEWRRRLLIHDTLSASRPAETSTATTPRTSWPWSCADRLPALSMLPPRP